MRIRTLNGLCRGGAVAVALSLVVSTAAFAQEGMRPLALVDYLSWETAQSPQISPDGDNVVYERSFVDAMKDRLKTELWLIGADGSKNRFLTDGGSPRWSPDGTRVAFLRDGQIFVRWMDAEGAESQVTRLDSPPSQIVWAPDSGSIAFRAVVDPGPDPAWAIDMPKAPEGAEWTGPPRIVTRLNYRRDGVGYYPRGFRHIFVVSADGGTPRQLTSGDYHHDGPRFVGDGSGIVFTSLRTPDAEHAWRESEIYRVEVATGRITTLTSRTGPDSGPVPSPDGGMIAYTGMDHTTDTYREEGLYVMDADGGNPRVIATEMGRRPGIVGWAADGSGVYFNAQLRGTNNLYLAPLDGEVRPVSSGNHMLSVSTVSGDGTAVGVVSAYHTPGNLVAFDVDSPDTVATLHVTNASILAEVTLGEVEEIWYKSPDGLDIQGWIVKPPDFDPSRKYPLILRIHGGPHAMYNSGFDFKNQDHAANGYVLLYTNPRGSSGYGSSFGNEIKNAYPGKDLDALMAGVDEVIARGYIDERNLFVYGGSGGGVLTSWIVGNTDRFTAAVSKAPVTNWFSFVGTTDGASWYRNFEKLPWEDPEEHLRRSTLMYVGNVTTPTMLMTGEKDLRTPMEQTEQYYKALKMRKIPTAMVRLTDSWHSRSRPPTNFMRVQLLLRNWFERFAVTDEMTTDAQQN
ncbi:MAG: S9 family peptidase [Acidobacteria bacterium]|nr:S9 family peptidase [Acidobacteriota bacterium]